MNPLRLFIIASLLFIPTAHAEPGFQQEWHQFVREKKVNFTFVGTPKYLIKEVGILEDFGNRQSSRQRKPILGIDRNIKWTPYRNNGVKLSNGRPMSASFIKLSTEQQPFLDDFIASQAPHAQNIDLFWQMIWEKQVQQVVMLTEFAEGVLNLCPPYWPQQLRSSMQLKNGLRITLVKKDSLLTKFSERIEISTLELNFRGKRRIVKHFWYRNWLDGRIPTQPMNFLTLMNRVNQEKVMAQTKGPILVHCHAGVGRTGVFIALYHLLQKKAVGESPSLFECVAHLRWQRPNMVSNPFQYRFCYGFLQMMNAY